MDHTTARRQRCHKDCCPADRTTRGAARHAVSGDRDMAMMMTLDHSRFCLRNSIATRQLAQIIANEKSGSECNHGTENFREPTVSHLRSSW
ncbi:hypothetical protein [Mesorhizobium sp. B1-1-8]|uniref:hypothetical protein n=1 Tax=Mesorhizobium sp. B1-1-8 TaxID=2589976 RepID=UPI001127A25E|nr:hypothetical protein [Mesorhizobium sp. B1-1-8]UCI05658.1 hypothetical protein FJ974_17640 [Mesorhizobium sp. B1-1-8]